MRIDFARFSSAVIAPAQGTKDSAGFDLYSVEDVLVCPNCTKIIRTGIGFKILRGYFEKFTPGRVLHLDSLRLVEVLLM